MFLNNNLYLLYTTIESKYTPKSYVVIIDFNSKVITKVLPLGSSIILDSRQGALVGITLEGNSIEETMLGKYDTGALAFSEQVGFVAVVSNTTAVKFLLLDLDFSLISKSDVPNGDFGMSDIQLYLTNKLLPLETKQSTLPLAIALILRVKSGDSGTGEAHTVNFNNKSVSKRILRTDFTIFFV
ncbi:hypothetical protein ABK040_015555 [Willaertia magna]